MRKPQLAEIEDIGYDAFWQGSEIDQNPYPDDSPEAEAWDIGWQAAEDEVNE